MTNNTKTVIWLVIIGVLLSLIVYTCNNPKVVVQIDTRHDTIRIDRFKVDTLPGTVKVIPGRVIYYHDTVWDYNTRIMLAPNTLTVTKHDTVLQVISNKFLMMFPESPKWIDGTFTGNSIKFSLLQTDGSLVTKSYLVDYTNNNYNFYQGEIKAKPIKPSFLDALKKIHSESFIYTTYNPVTNGASLAIDYSLMYGKFGLYGFGRVTTNQVPHADAGIGLKVQIK